MQVRNILLISLLAAATAIGMTTACAQEEESEGPSVRELVDQELELFRTELGLSDYTWTQVELILKSGIRERVAIAQRYGIDQEGGVENLTNKDKRHLRKELKESRKNTEDRMERYLDKEQMKTFEDFQEQQRDQMLARLEQRPVETAAE